jgi:hypothetical protein
MNLVKRSISIQIKREDVNMFDICNFCAKGPPSSRHTCSFCAILILPAGAPSSPLYDAKATEV